MVSPVISYTSDRHFGTRVLPVYAAVWIVVHFARLENRSQVF